MILLATSTVELFVPLIRPRTDKAGVPDLPRATPFSPLHGMAAM